jgi:hypothetical protein
MATLASLLRKVRLVRPIRLNPSYILIFLLTLAVAAALLERSVQDRRSRVIEAREGYLAALTATRTQLAGLMDKAASDKALTHSLNNKLEHSLKSTLDAQLQKGGLDQLALVSAACEPQVRAAVSRYVAIPCPEGKPTQRFFWITTNDGPTLALMRSLPDQAAGGGLFLLGVVHLNEFWLAKQPTLESSLKDLGLSVAPLAADAANSKALTTVLREGEISDGGFAAALVSSNILDRLLVSSAGKDIAYGNPFLMPTLMLAILTGLFVLVREKTLLKRLQQSGHDLVGWAKSVSPAGGFTAPGKSTVIATGVPAKDLLLAKDLITKAIDLKNEQIHKMGQRRENAEARIREMSSEIMGLQKRLSELAELDSLAVQLGNTSQGFLEHVQDMNLKAEDMSDIAGTEMAERAAMLHNMLMEWQEGVAARGSRKFIRSLAESPGRAKESSLLDDQIMTIATIAGELSDLAVNASLLAHKIAETSSFSARIAGLWHGIALKTNSDKVCKSLIPVMEDAQELIRQNRKYRNVSFQNLVPEDSAGAIPEIPVTLWQSAMFQIYAAFAELSSGKTARIVSRIRKDGDKTMFVVHIVGVEGVQLPQRTQRQTYLLDVAKYVLTPFDVKVTALPTLDGPFPVALCWQSESAALQIEAAGDFAGRVGTDEV